MIGGPILITTLSARNMGTDYDWGIIRCIYGFAAGAITWNIYRNWNGELRKWLSGSIVEWGALGLVVVFVSAAGATLLSIAAPYIFALVVLVFAFEAGSASAILRLRPLVFLGTISYSIYMTHLFIAKRMFDAGYQLDKRWHINPFTYREIDGGNVELLKRLGAELKFTVHGMAAVALDGKAVSSTRIREAIRGGNLDTVSQMLGRAYSIAGCVIKGDGLGRQLGFPTANIDVTGLALPPNGVYAVRASFANKTHRAVLNIGNRPTLRNRNPQLQVESHLIDFAGDMYGQELEVTFVERLRDEKKFASLDELRDQISKDICEAQLRF